MQHWVCRFLSHLDLFDLCIPSLWRSTCCLSSAAGPKNWLVDRFLAAGLGKQDSYAQLVSTESAVSLLGLWGMRGPYSLQNLSKSWSAQVSNLIVGRGTMVTMATTQLDYNQRLWAKHCQSKKSTQHGFFPDGENFVVSPKQSSDGT